MRFLVLLVLFPAFLQAIDAACCFSDSFTMDNITVNVSSNKTVEDPNSDIVYKFFANSKISAKLSADYKGARFALSGSMKVHSDMLFSGADHMTQKFQVLAVFKGSEPFVYVKVDGEITGKDSEDQVYSKCVKIPMEPMIQYVLPNYKCLPQMMFMPNGQVAENGMRSMVLNPRVVLIPGQLEILFDKDICAPAKVLYQGQVGEGVEVDVEFTSEPKEGVEESVFEAPDMSSCHEMTTEQLAYMMKSAVSAQ